MCNDTRSGENWNQNQETGIQPVDFGRAYYFAHISGGLTPLLDRMGLVILPAAALG
jgi:hypothetical protein